MDPNFTKVRGSGGTRRYKLLVQILLLSLPIIRVRVEIGLVASHCVARARAGGGALELLSSREVSPTKMKKKKSYQADLCRLF